MLFLSLFIDVQYMHEHAGGTHSHSHHRHSHSHEHHSAHDASHVNHHHHYHSRADHSRHHDEHLHSQVTEVSAAEHIHVSFLWFEFSYEVVVEGHHETEAESTAVGPPAERYSETAAGVPDAKTKTASKWTVILRPDSLFVFLKWEFKSPHDPVCGWKPGFPCSGSLEREPDVYYLSPVYPPLVPPPEVNVG
ncbi:MAG: hypothetical protein KDA65_12370 [Planctomycetaceae bacterium]|nr:hypothetical protein [Planctomycetaceae bacterium]